MNGFVARLAAACLMYLHVYSVADQETMKAIVNRAVHIIPFAQIVIFLIVNVKDILTTIVSCHKRMCQFEMNAPEPIRVCQVVPNGEP